MSNNAQLATALVAAAGAAGGAYCVYRAYQAHRNRLPQKWIRVGTLKELHVYPVKSCGPVPKEQVECTGMGLKSGWLRDRALMVVDDTSNAITARNYPELYSVHPSIKDSVLTLSNTDLGTISIDLAEVIALQKSLTSTVWSIAVPVYDCGDEVSDWLTKLINRPSGTFRLVYYASQAGRKAPGNAIGKLYNITNKDTGSLTDDTSYNLINEASVEDLNSRLQDVTVTARNFRPNFLLAGAKPYDEDDWKFVKIGENIFKVVMPCARCVMTTVDPETGVRNDNSEPLKTLRSYRLMEGEKHRKVMGTAPRMGLQLALRSAPGGRISLNDDIYVA